MFITSKRGCTKQPVILQNKQPNNNTCTCNQSQQLLPTQKCHANRLFGITSSLPKADAPSWNGQNENHLGIIHLQNTSSRDPHHHQMDQLFMNNPMISSWCGTTASVLSVSNLKRIKWNLLLITILTFTILHLIHVYFRTCTENSRDIKTR